MKRIYVDKKFHSNNLKLVNMANVIISEYEKQGYNLTLRQLYYQFVARDIIPNTPKSYKRLGSIINDGRLAGLIDWDSIVDRTRGISGRTSWESPEEILRAAARSYYKDHWENSFNYVEVWVEKEALSEIVEKAVYDWGIYYMCCRGYVSQSAMYRASKRFIWANRKRKSCYLLHLGDHDPSGIDMSRDIEERLFLFGAKLSLQRVALNMDQIERYNPPPNPAKLTDSRCKDYIGKYGYDSWELDALEPSVISDIIKDNIEELVDWDSFTEAREQMEKERLGMFDFINSYYGEEE